MTTAYTEIGKYDVYNERMAKSMLDKLFFVDKVDAQFFVDYGCADGTLFKYMRQYLPSVDFLGYDNSDYAVTIARQSNTDQKTTFTGDLEEVKKRNNEVHDRVCMDGSSAQHKTCLVLNSVIHEVYNYADRQQIDYFWHTVFCSRFDYIVIRDMIPSESVDRVADLNYPFH